MSGPDIAALGRAACFGGVDMAPYNLYAALWRKVLDLEMNYADTNTGYVRNPTTVLSIAVNPAMETQVSIVIDVHLAFGGWAWSDHLPPFGHTQADTIGLCAGGERGVDDRFPVLPLTTLATPVNEGYGDISHVFPTDWEVVVSGGSEDTHHYYSVPKIAAIIGTGIYGVTMSIARAVELIKGLYGLGMTAWPLIDKIGLFHRQITFTDSSGTMVEAAYPGYARQPLSIVADTLESTVTNIFEPPGPAGPTPYNAVSLFAGSELMATAFLNGYVGQPAPVGGGNWGPATGSLYRNLYQMLAQMHLMPIMP